MLNRRLVEPAMGLAWIDWHWSGNLGRLDSGCLADYQSWYFVITLSALHGMLTGRLKRTGKSP